MTEMMQALMSGALNDAQSAALLVALRMKGESVDEITAAARVMRGLSTPVQMTQPESLIDTCGTGGDGQHTFNVSTTVAFVVAAAGGRVAKHGGRSVTSSSGSADLLELAGVNLSITPQMVANSIDREGVGFMFAPAHHGAMKHVVTVRKSLGVRTMFNLLGPITNPAGAQRQVLGVFAEQWLEPMAKVLKALGSRKVWVVHADDGLDEISIASATQVVALSETGELTRFTVSPEQVGYARAALADIRAVSKEDSLAMVKRVLANEPGPWRDIVCLNAGAALLVGGLVADFPSGVRLAEAVIANGAAQQKFDAVIALTQQLGTL
ncbi:MAG: anthranilate phosphoribosyltransferase [Proteobacteria bacterium]|nr:anthranilate phosphoribosyltransferase [Pseudomonadota bacterium]